MICVSFSLFKKKNKHSAHTNFCTLQFQYFLKDPVKYDVKYQVCLHLFSSTRNFS
jgi:hypothetical protein